MPGSWTPKPKIKDQKSKIFIDTYQASGGREYFLSFEDKKRQVVYAFCRLRINQLTNQPTNYPPPYPAFIRELHTYGQMETLKHKNPPKANPSRAGIKTLKQANEVQHTGLGKTLLAQAEKICQKNKIKKLAVISGVGVREYYRKQGYKLENGYMMKKLP